MKLECLKLITTNSIQSGWKPFFTLIEQKPYFLKLVSLVNASQEKLCPPIKNIFKVFELCDLSNIKILIIGEEPYTTLGIADGIAFSSKQIIPPSLKNIFKEVNRTENVKLENGDLTPWVAQGVFLINVTLTALINQPRAHEKIGWKLFFEDFLVYLQHKCQNKKIICFLWGKKAQNYEYIINKTNWHILKSPHPSPLSAYRGFYNNNHFKIANDILKKEQLSVINWEILN